MGILLSALATAAINTAVITTAAPDPAPYGPQRPYEPDVPGPVNIETGEASVTKDGGTPKGVIVTFDTQRTTESGEKPAAPRRFVFLFDRSIRFNSELLPTCDRATLEQGRACPEGSKVGSGRAEFYPVGTGEVVVYNTKYANGMRGVLITIPATGAILQNTFERVSRPYQDEYTWGSDEIIPPDATPPQDRGVTKAFNVSFGAVHKGRSFVESHAPAGRNLRIGVWGQYVTGQVLLGEQTVKRP
jgi:hypothetical protein